MIDSTTTASLAVQEENVFAEAVSEEHGHRSRRPDAKMPHTPNGRASHEISMRKFLSLQPQPGIKLEWVDGKLVKTDKSMNWNQLYILLNLQKFFESTVAYQQKLGRLQSEFDSHLKPKSIRRPDLAYLTDEQVYLAADEKDPLIPSFAIEIISPNEKYEESEQKLKDYLNAGIQVVWHIFPKLKTVKIFRPTEKTEECSGDETVCSAAPALPDFQMSIAEIFWKPQA